MTVLSKSQRARFLAALRQGLPPESAASLVGMPWIKVQQALDRAHINAAEPDLPPDLAAEVRLYLDYKKAVATWENQLVGLIQEGDPNWRGAAWLLSHRFTHWANSNSQQMLADQPLKILDSQSVEVVLSKYEKADGGATLDRLTIPLLPLLPLLPLNRHHLGYLHP